MIGFELGAARTAKRIGDFDPTTVSTLRSWHRASLGVTDDGGGKCSAWADQSGAGDSNRNFAQSTSGNRPTINSSNSNFNNKPTLDFATDDYLVTGTFSSTYAQPVTIYAVFRHASANGDYLFDDLDGTSRLALTVGTGAGISFYFAGGSPVDTFTSSATTYVLCVVYNGSSSAAYLNNISSSTSSGDAGSNSLKSFTLGSRFSVTAWLTGSVAELLSYSGAHNSTDRGTVMNGLGTLYGVSITP